MKTSRVLIIVVAFILSGAFLSIQMPGVMYAQSQRRLPDSALYKIIRPMAGWILPKFDDRVHVKRALPSALQSNHKNPFLHAPQRQVQTFQYAINHHLPPGIEYETGGAPVRAIASGIVSMVGEVYEKPGYPGGFYVRVVHDNYDGLKEEFYPRVPLYRYQAYRSSYYFLSKVNVVCWQTAKRGQIIGYGMTYGADKKEKVKIVLEERGNWVNPDDYGVGHGPMTYWDNTRIWDMDLEEMNQRLDRQVHILAVLNSYYEKADDSVFRNIHGVIDTRKSKNYPVEWSTLDRFKYLAHIYANSAELFTGLDLATFNQLKDEFYQNQPIVLTLPFSD